MLRPADYPSAPLRSATAALGAPAALRALADELGYLYLPALVPLEQLDPVRALVRRYAEDQGWVLAAPGNPPCFTAAPAALLTGRGWDDPRWSALQRRLRVAPEFIALATAPPLLEALAALYGEPACVATANYCWIKLPGAPAQTTRPHQDSYYLPGCPGLWTAWLPLLDTPIEVGSLGVVPGSHRRGAWHHEHPLIGIDVPPDTPWATADFFPGDVVLFGADTVHCAWSNVSVDRVRAAFDLRFEPLSSGETSALRPVPFGSP